MKILLSGEPRAGKSTLISHLVTELKSDYWELSEEIRDANNERVGFLARNSLGQSEVFAHKIDIVSDQQIADYKVSLEAIDSIFTAPIEQMSHLKRGLVIIDEIGRMEMLSPDFVQGIDRLFETEVDMIATIRYQDEWTHKYTDRDDVTYLVLTPDNRIAIKHQIEKLAENFGHGA